MQATATDGMISPVWAARSAMVCGSVVTAMGITVLAGWWLDVPVLKSVYPGTVSMKANTALAFVLAGAALVLLSGTPVSPRRARGGRLLALLVVLIGGLTLCELIFGWQLRIDELLFRDDPDAAATLIPGRMAPSTAVDFLLLGLALLGIEWEPRRGFRPAEVLALVAGLVSLISLAEYTLGEPILYGFSHYTRMALHTIAAFLVLSAGVLLARPAQGMAGVLGSGGISRLEQWIYAAIALALLALLAGGAWFYHAQEQQARDEAANTLEAIARLKVNQIVQWRAERVSDAAVLMSSEFLAEGVKRWIENSQADLAARILRRFRSMQEYNRYRDVLLVDTHGQVRLGPSGGASALDPEVLQAVATAIREQRPVLSDLYIMPPDRMPRASLIALLFDRTNGGLKPIGAVILTIEARQFLYPLIQSWPTASSSAEILLVRREGDAVLYLNDLRHRPDTAFKLRIPLTQQQVPSVMAVMGREGVFEGEDYRGIKVLSVTKQIPDTSWSMVAKVDEAEALADWRFRARLIVAVIAALALALVAATMMIWQNRNKYRALSRSTDEIRRLNEELELRVRQRTAQLESANKDMESFSYSVSHDLRTPLRAIDGFSKFLLDEYSGKLDREGIRLLNVVRNNTVNMSRLIDDILAFSRAGRQAMTLFRIDMNRLARSVFDELESAAGGRKINFVMAPLPAAMADQSMMRQVFVNLFANAIKFTRSKESASIEADGRSEAGENIYCVRDNGVGFDPQYTHKLFGVFQRLHSTGDFEGTGIGLAIVKRVINKHGGRVWAEGKVNEGAKFYFTLPQVEPGTAEGGAA